MRVVREKDEGGRMKDEGGAFTLLLLGKGQN
jgi:hypothetical protein